jgi:hypothetical protein
MPFNHEEYQKAIPKCCKYQTVEEHANYMLLCWGLLSAIKHNEEMDCGTCDLRNDIKGDTV